MNQGKLEVMKQDSKSEHRHFRNGQEWVNLTQMTIISTTVDKNPLEEME